MMKPNSKKNRAKNAKEKAWQGWLKLQNCSFCNASGPSIVDHIKGSTFKNQGRMIGEIFCNSKCLECDTKVTLGARRKFHEECNMTDSDATLDQLNRYHKETGIFFPTDDLNAIADVYAVNEDVTDWMKVL